MGVAQACHPIVISSNYFLDSFRFVSARHVDVGICTIRMNSPQNASFQIPYARASERPAVVPCTTSGVLVRNVFPVPFELKFCQFDFDNCLFERQFLISETTCLMMVSFQVDVKQQFEV